MELLGQGHIANNQAAGIQSQLTYLYRITWHFLKHFP